MDAKDYQFQQLVNRVIALEDKTDAILEICQEVTTNPDSWSVAEFAAAMEGALLGEND